MVLDSSPHEFHPQSLCVSVWSSGLKKRQKLGKLSKPLGTTTQVRGRTGLCCRLWYQLAWTVNSGVWASFKWDLRLVILSPRLVKGEHMTGCLGPGSDWCVPEFLCALLSMWWETLKCGQYGVTIKGCLVNWGYSYAGVLLAWVSGGREMWGEAAVGWGRKGLDEESAQNEIWQCVSKYQFMHIQILKS